MIDLMGWDIGGAHLKAVAMAGDQIVSILQKPCPLWLGLGHFHDAAIAILDELQPLPGCRHAITMTGELADVFATREAGVFALLHALCEHVPTENVLVFAGRAGFLAARRVKLNNVPAIASANWLATGVYAATRLEQGLLIDIGSTSTDLLVLHNREVLTRGHTDFERLCHGELVYCGVVRTALMSLAKLAPFEGEWIGVMAEHFATTADVYRLTGELPEYADQASTADGGEKTAIASARRMARLLGRDIESSTHEAWRRLGFYYRERQLAVLMEACMRQLSRGELDCNAPVIGAGVGRFLVQELAKRLGHTYLDFSGLHPMPSPCTEFHLADCAPALAVACLARQTYV
jgi:probable H4MPT-linked C1 transfer pathway protein